jgi:hypothetical protein
MAIESIREIWEERAANLSAQGSRTYTRVFRVVTSDNLRAGLECCYLGDLDGNAIPRMWTPYVLYDNAGAVIEYDGGSWVQSLSPKQDAEDPRIWTVTVQYSSELPQPRAERPGENIGPGGSGPGGIGRPNSGGPGVGPAGAPPPGTPNIPEFPKLEIEWSFAKYQRAALSDLNNNLVANSAGQRFDPPLMIDDSRPIVRITRNELYFDPALAIRYQDTINSDRFFGAEPRTAKLNIGPVVYQYQNGIQFWRVTYTIEFRFDNWKLKVLDEGYMEKDTDHPPDLKPIIVQGEKVPSPYPLDGDGHKGDPQDPQYLEFKVYREVPFAPLGLAPV